MFTRLATNSTSAHQRRTLAFGDVDVETSMTTRNARAGPVPACEASPDGRDSVEFAAELMKKKVAVIPGNAFYVDTEKPCDGLRLNYSMPSFENIDKAIKAMGECING